jgi:hypothetical protein
MTRDERRVRYRVVANRAKQLLQALADIARNEPAENVERYQRGIAVAAIESAIRYGARKGRGR